MIADIYHGNVVCQTHLPLLSDLLKLELEDADIRSLAMTYGIDFLPKLVAAVEYLQACGVHHTTETVETTVHAIGFHAHVEQE